MWANLNGPLRSVFHFAVAGSFLSITIIIVCVALQFFYTQIVFVGFLIGSLFWGYFCDAFGRKTVRK